MTNQNSDEDRAIKRVREQIKIVEEIEVEVFGKRQNGLLKNRVPAIEKKTGLKAPKDKASFFDRIACLYEKIVGGSNPNLIPPPDNPF